MDTAKWIEHRRDEDNELLGYITISEASPTRLVVANADFGYEGNIGDRFVLDVPCTVLTRQ